jgi:hypothetical protein
MGGIRTECFVGSVDATTIAGRTASIEAAATQWKGETTGADTKFEDRPVASQICE